MTEDVQKSFLIFTLAKRYIMAKSMDNILLRYASGQIGKQIVVKRYGKKTVITSYPDMSHVKPSKQQKLKRKKFAGAVAYAQAIINDPVRKLQYAKKVKNGQTVYHYAMQEFFGKAAGS